MNLMNHFISKRHLRIGGIIGFFIGVVLSSIFLICLNKCAEVGCIFCLVFVLPAYLITAPLSNLRIPILNSPAFAVPTIIILNVIIFTLVGISMGALIHLVIKKIKRV